MEIILNVNKFRNLLEAVSESFIEYDHLYFNVCSITSAQYNLHILFKIVINIELYEML